MYAEFNGFNNQTGQWQEVSSLDSTHPWQNDALRKIAELAEMPADWDSYGSRPIQPPAHQQAARAVMQFSRFALAAPQVFPVPGGGIQLEWQSGESEAELEFLPNGEMHLLIQDGDGEIRDMRLANSLVSHNQLVALARWLMTPSNPVSKLHSLNV